MEIQRNRDCYSDYSKLRRPRRCAEPPIEHLDMFKSSIDSQPICQCQKSVCECAGQSQDDVSIQFPKVSPATALRLRQNYLDTDFQGFNRVSVDRPLTNSKSNEPNEVMVVFERRSSSPKFHCYEERPNEMKTANVVSQQDEFEEFRRRALSLPHKQLAESRSPNFRRPSRVSKGNSPRLDEVYVHEATNSPSTVSPVSHRPNTLKKLMDSEEAFKQDSNRRFSLSWGLKSDLGKLALRNDGSFKIHKPEVFRARAATLSNSREFHHWREAPVSDDDNNWTPTRSPSRIEQRFLKLPESAEYDKVRSFNINKDGKLVNTSKGYVYRLRNDVSPTISNVDSSLLPSPLSITAEGAESFKDLPIKRYVILLIGAEEVGKSSLIILLQSCDLIDGGRCDTSNETKQIIPVLISGREVDLFFAEWDVLENKKWKLNIACAAILVMYSISDNQSFSTAADVLYQIRDSYSEEVPIILVANKVDLERQRSIQTNDGKELAKSYNCKFIEVSVVLGHETDELLRQLLLELRKYEKRNSLVSSGVLNSLKSNSKKKRHRTVVAVKQRANSLYHAQRVDSFSRRLARSCEDLIARLWK